jgi:glycosyltransferase involved in cell wall biosynthesis
MSRCFFIAAPGGEGAVTYHFMALGNALAERGHHVIMLLAGQVKEKERLEGNPLIYTWPSIRPVKWRDAYFLFKLISKFHPDCLISNFGANNVMMLVGWLQRVPLRIRWYHTLTSQINIDAKIPRWYMNFLTFRKHCVNKTVTHLVPVSKAALTDVTTNFHVPLKKCKVIHNSLNDPILHEKGINNFQHKNFFCPARLDHSKGQDVLIKATAIIRNDFPDFFVEFLGKGPANRELKDLVSQLRLEQNCKFSGLLPHAEVLKRMAIARTVILPSRSDNCPYALIESIAVGTPVIASNVGGIPEIIRDGVDGFLVPPGNPEALAEKIKAILTDQNLRETMSNNARQHYLNNFELNRSVREQIAWLEGLLRGCDPESTYN